MKKLLTVLFSIICVLSPTGCKKHEDYTQRISQLRENIFFSQCENFMIFAYPEIRENPYENDGFIGKKENVIIFRLIFTLDSEKGETPTISFTIDEKNYSQHFEFKPAVSTLDCTVKTDALPTSDFYVRLKFEKEKEIMLCSLKKNSVFDYRDIINLLKVCNNNTVEDFLNHPDSYELKIRLLENSGYNFWYVGVIGKENAVAVLFDAENGEEIAVKKLEK